jgi:hypothetical protein
MLSQGKTPKQDIRLSHLFPIGRHASDAVVSAQMPAFSQAAAGLLGSASLPFLTFR